MKEVAVFEADVVDFLIGLQEAYQLFFAYFLRIALEHYNLKVLHRYS